MMSECLNQSAPGAPGTPVAHRTGRLFFAVWGQAWLLTILGGGGCGLVCAGFVSMVFLFWTIPGGMYLGFFLGIPLGLVIAVLVTRRATPPGDPARLTRQLELVGITIAMLIIASINLYLVGAAILVDTDIDYRPLLAPAATVNGALAVAAGAVVGRESGLALAARHLKRFNLAVPPRIALFGRITRRRRTDN